MGTGPFIGVEAIGTQVWRHHLLDQGLKAQVVFGHTPGLMNSLQGNGVHTSCSSRSLSLPHIPQVESQAGGWVPLQPHEVIYTKVTDPWCTGGPGWSFEGQLVLPRKGC